MSTNKPSNRGNREPLSPQTIAARFFAVLFLISLFLVIFVFPWLAVAAEAGAGR